MALLPLAIVGGIAGASIGSRKARAHRSYYSRHHSRRERGAIRQARPAAPAPELAARDADTGPVPRHAGRPGHPALSRPAGRVRCSGHTPPMASSNTPLDLPATTASSGAWLGDVIDGMFAPPPVRETMGRASNDGVRAWGSLCGSEPSAAPDITIARIREAVQPTAAQQARDRRAPPGARSRHRAHPNACPAGQAARRPNGCT